MKQKKQHTLLGIMLAFTLALAGCSSTGANGGTPAPAGGQAGGNSGQAVPVTIGIAVQYEPIFQAAQASMKEKGYDLKITVFDDVVTPNTALEEGSIDANFFQHKPYMDAYNESNGGHLVALEPYWMHQLTGLYSSRYSSIEELPEGGDILILADPSSQSLALKFLQESGLITLEEIPEGEFYNIHNVKENPRKFNFVEIDMGTAQGAYEDVDAAVFATIGMFNAGLDYSHPLAMSQDFTEFPMVVAVRENNKDAAWTKDLMEVLTTDEMRDLIVESLGGTFEPLF